MPAEPIAAALESAIPERKGEKQTAKKAVRILVEKRLGFHEPTRAERDALLVGFAMHRKVLYGAAFDVVRMSAPVDLSDPVAISAQIDALSVFEIKSTNRHSVKADFSGYFFDLTTAELLVAQSLGPRYRFAFVNTVTGEHLEMAVTEVFAKARKIYPKWAVTF